MKESSSVKCSDISDFHSKTLPAMISRLLDDWEKQKQLLIAKTFFCPPKKLSLDSKLDRLFINNLSVKRNQPKTCTPTKNQLRQVTVSAKSTYFDWPAVI